MVMFISSIQAAERILSDEPVLKGGRRKSLLSSFPIKLEDCSEIMPSSCLSFVTSCSSTEFSDLLDCADELTEADQTKILSSLPSGVILIITSFLDNPDQLKLSHANNVLKDIIGEKFWENQIAKQRYLLWDTSLPRAKIFFANYFYQRGFGRDPRLPEKIVYRLEDVSLPPSLRLAQKSLDLGFPKGRENYSQVQHKIMMLRVQRVTQVDIIKAYTSSHYFLSLLPPSLQFLLKF